MVQISVWFSRTANGGNLEAMRYLELVDAPWVGICVFNLVKVLMNVVSPAAKFVVHIDSEVFLSHLS